MTTENTPATPKTTTSSRSTAAKKKEEEVVALSVKEPARLGLPNNRPIEPSHLEITSTYRAVGGDRPVTQGTMEISRTMTISGNRPIMVSHLEVSDLYIMGKRPIAPNETPDMADLIGYLD